MLQIHFHEGTNKVNNLKNFEVNFKKIVKVGKSSILGVFWSNQQLNLGMRELQQSFTF